MGDVFEAMNRARRERQEASQPAPPSPPQDEAADTGPAPDPRRAEAGGGLAFDQVDTPALVQEPGQDDGGDGGEDFAAHAAPRTAPVAAATRRAQTDAEQEFDNRLDLQIDEHTALPSRDRAKLNGYSAEIVVHHDRGSAVTEQYRAIRTQLLARARNRTIQTTVLTSSTPEEGKSVTTANLGIAFSELRNKKTLLVEGDLRRPSFTKLFDRECQPGLLQVLRGEINSIDEAIHETVYGNLQFLPAGGRDSTHSTELLSSPRMMQIMEQLKDRYDHIFIDTPPVITVTDACILGAMADQVLMVVRLNKTPSGAVERAKRLLRASNCDVSGVILTHMRHFISRYLYKYSYGYGYGYGYGYTTTK